MSDRLKEIEERLAIAEPGPWENDQDGEVVSPRGCVVCIAQTYRHVETPHYPDAQFIAHAREDVPWLVARVRELEAAARPYLQGQCRCLTHELDPPEYRCEHCAKLAQLLGEVPR